MSLRVWGTATHILDSSPDTDGEKIYSHITTIPEVIGIIPFAEV